MAKHQPAISYAQFYEDMHLARCFEEQPTGFYIDVGAGHPVHCNVSFYFYLRGWSGITVEPNPWLNQLTEAVRPRDRRIDALLGATPGQANYHLVDEFHGLSTTLESHAQAVQQEYGKTFQTFPVPVTTLRAVCSQYASKQIDFLKIDVEGAEQAVLEGNDWGRFRPKVVLAEALVPITLKPAWESWEPILIANGYRFAFFDGLNRYYADQDQPAVHALLARARPSFKGIKQIHQFKPALDDRKHPDHHLALLLKGADMIRLPLLGRRVHVELLTAGIAPDELDRPATAADAAAISERVFGPLAVSEPLPLHRNATIRDLYDGLVATAQFRTACGRISASYAW